MGVAVEGGEGVGRRADIQGLRALAVLLVVAFHADLPVPGGFTGVDVFFVISGFVIARLLVRELGEGDRISFARFYARRVRRILPALAVMLVVVSVLSLGAVSPLKPKQVTAKTGVAAATMTANVYLYQSPRGYFGVGPAENPLLHTWSLSVEEQFYLGFPLLLAGAWFLGRRTRRPRAVLAVVVGIAAVGSFALCLAATKGLIFDERFAFYMAPTRAWEFCAGVLVFLISGRLARIPSVVSSASAALGGLLVGAAAFGFDGTTPFPGLAALLPVLGTALLLVAGLQGARPALITRLLASPPMVWIGDRSYAWYLWHWPLIVFARAIWPLESNVALIAAVIALVPACLSYRWVETPVRSDPRIVGARALAVAAICVVVPMVAGVALGRVRLPFDAAASRARLAALSSRHLDEIRHCTNPNRLPYEVPRCIITASEARGTIVLIGDSNAGQFTEPIAAAAASEGRRFVVATRHGCRFADVEVVRMNKPPEVGCRRHNLATVDALIAHQPDLVVIASSSPEIVEPRNIALRDPIAGVTVRSPAAKARIWKEGVERLLRRLTDADIEVVQISTIPQFPGWQPNCAAVRVYLAPSSCGISRSRAAVERLRHRAVTAERAAARAVGATTIDFADVVCSPRECRTNVGDRWLYRDGNHLSVAGSRRLIPQFVAVIRAHAGSARGVEPAVEARAVSG